MTTPRPLETPADRMAFDRDHVWHPYASMTDPSPAHLVVGAQGVRLRLANGSQPIDGMSSWWAAIHGYRNAHLTRAIRQQAGDYAHVMFGGLTHAPAIRLAHALLEIVPAGLEKVFFSDSGSVSVEVALKMVRQYARGIGHPERTKILSFHGGYHGDTLGAMSVTDPAGGMHAMWADQLPEQLWAPQPPASEYDVIDWARDFARVVNSRRHEIAGIIVEPLLQGAGGMHPYPSLCLTVMRDVADVHGIPLIFDEIATGFGRTGHLFAADSARVTPDIMCLGKALTGGTMSMAATLCTAEIARGVSASESGVLMHGPTFMGNPLACAAALASLELLRDGDWAHEVAHINYGLSVGLEPLRSHPRVIDVRTLGAVGVVQLDHPVDVVAATEAALEAGVWLRPFRDLIYTMPPYPCDREEVEQICSAIAAAVEVA